MGKGQLATKRQIYRKYATRALHCPKCGRGRLIDENTSVKSEMHVVENDEPSPADYYIKCAVCKAQIGVRKIE